MFWILVGCGLFRGVSEKRSFNGHKDRSVFLNNKMFDKKSFSNHLYFDLNV